MMNVAPYRFAMMMRSLPWWAEEEAPCPR